MVRSIVFIAFLSACASNPSSPKSDFSKWQVPTTSKILQISHDEKPSRSVASVFNQKSLKKKYFQSLYSTASKLKLTAGVKSCPKFHDTWASYDKEASNQELGELGDHIKDEIIQFCEKGYTQNYYKFVNLLRDSKNQEMSQERVKRKLSSDPLVIIQHHAIKKGVQSKAHFEFRDIIENTLRY